MSQQVRSGGHVRCIHASATAVTLDRFVAPLEQELARRGLDSTFVVGSRAAPEISDSRVTTIPVDLGRGIDIRTGLHLNGDDVDAILRYEPDVIFVHTPATALSGVRLWSHLRSTGVKIVYVARGSLDESDSLLTRAAWRIIDPLRWRLWDGFLVVNSYLEGQARTLHPFKPVVRATMGCAWPNVPRETLCGDSILPPQHGGLRLAWMGRLDSDKRPRDFVTLVEILRAEFGLDVHGVMVGATLLGDRQAKFELGSHVSALGWRDHPSMDIAGCDLLISTSIREGYGLGPIEAALVGTPTIAYDNHGTRESVPAVQGQLVARGDVQALAQEVANFARLSRREVVQRRALVRAAAFGQLRAADPAREFAELALSVQAAQ